MKNGMIECSVCHSKLVSPNTKAVSRAYDRYRSKISSKQRALNILLVVGDCILVFLQVIAFLWSFEIVLSYYSQKDKKEHFDRQCGFISDSIYLVHARRYYSLSKERSCVLWTPFYIPRDKCMILLLLMCNMFQFSILVDPFFINSIIDGPFDS